MKYFARHILDTVYKSKSLNQSINQSINHFFFNKGQLTSKNESKAFLWVCVILIERPLPPASPSSCK